MSFPNKQLARYAKRLESYLVVAGAMSSSSHTESASQIFRSLYRREPEGAWAAPGRVNLIGEFTDFNEGFVLPLALAFKTEVAAARRADGVFRLASKLGDQLETVELPPGTDLVRLRSGWSRYIVGVIWALQLAGCTVDGLDLAVSSEVPIGAGLSSSAALECAVALALRDLYEFDLSRLDLAGIARLAENEFVGVPTGAMDQIASLCGTAGHALLLDTRTNEIEPIPFDPTAETLALLVVDTGVRHELANSAYADRQRQCMLAAERMGVRALRDLTVDDLERVAVMLDRKAAARVRHVVSENARVQRVANLLRCGELAAIGPVLTASHLSLRHDFEVSSVELDLAVDTILAAGGGYGARMTGGGFGGSAIGLVAAREVDGIRDAVTDAFREQGLGVPRFFIAVASDGASRLMEPLRSELG